MQDNTVEFRAAFNRIENFLRKKGGYDTWKDFSSMLKEQAEHDSYLRQYADDLDAMRELRNILVHQEGVSNDPIANPYPSTIKKLNSIYEALTNPPTVNSIMIKNVATTDFSSLLPEALRLMEKECFTVLPVIEDGRVCAVLSEYTLMKWCGARLDIDGAILEARVVTDISEYLDRPDSSDKNATYQFAARDALLASVSKQFQTAAHNGTRLNAVFITQHGKQAEKLLGLVTAWDIT